MPAPEDDVEIEPITGFRAKIKILPWSRICAVFLIICVIFILLACILFEKLRTARTERFENYHKELVHQINAADVGWKAQYNPNPTFVEKVKMPVNAKWWQKENIDILRRNWYIDSQVHIGKLRDTVVDLPPFFDAREKWRQCWTVHDVPNQGRCGNCWATAAVATMADRICIHSNLSVQVLLSLDDLTGCCQFCGGCGGSISLLTAFDFWLKNGLVTGGHFGSSLGCKPYSIPADCGAPCPYYFYASQPAPDCNKQCDPLYNRDYKSDKNYAKTVYSLSADYMLDSWHKYRPEWIGKSYPKFDFEEKQKLLKTDLYLNGPVCACFNAAEDLQHFKSGIYEQFPSARMLYGHCAKILGWGTENNETFWIMAGTWGRSWGESGFFRTWDMPEELVSGIPDITFNE